MVAPLLMAGLVYAGCKGAVAQAPKGPTPPPPGQLKTSKEDLDNFRKRVLAAQEKRKQRQEILNDMKDEALIEELRKDSTENVEPFNSMAYRKAIERKSAVSLQSAVEREPFLLGLLALRRLDQARYRKIDVKVRVRLLMEAMDLEKQKTFNILGLPHLYWEEAASAIIEEGIAEREAKDTTLEKELRGRLRVTNRTQLYGSHEALESEKYQYRVRDYAWALLQAIERPGEKMAIHPDPNVRDKAIEAWERKP